MKNEVKKKMKMKRRESCHQSHDEFVTIAKVNNIFLASRFSSSKILSCAGGESRNSPAGSTSAAHPLHLAKSPAPPCREANRALVHL
jgi:hypothetical protein